MTEKKRERGEGNREVGGEGVREGIGSLKPYFAALLCLWLDGFGMWGKKKRLLGEGAYRREGRGEEGREEER